MAKARKTIDVAPLKDRINAQILRETSVDARKALCNLLESILFEANRYGGFNDRYWSETGYDLWVADGRPDEFPSKFKYIWGPAGTNEDGTYSDPFLRKYH